jgi:predicted dithiol-disulfide oxidoreductase (DUF899 family)
VPTQRSAGGPRRLHGHFVDRPRAVDRVAWQRKIDELYLREKAHTRERDAIAAARRRLPMVDASTPVVGAHGEVPLIDVFEGRSQLFASYMMWYAGAGAAHQCEGCTMNMATCCSSATCTCGT